MTIESKKTIGLFLSVSLNSEIKSTECCGREITIKCLLGTREIVKRTMKIPECDGKNDNCICQFHNLFKTFKRCAVTFLVDVYAI